MNVFDTDLKQTFRAHIIFEQITGETFTAKNLTQVITFFYATVMASNPTLDLEFDTFLTYLDEHPESLTEFVNWVVETDRRNADLNPTETKGNTEETTVKKSNRVVTGVGFRLPDGGL